MTITNVLERLVKFFYCLEYKAVSKTPLAVINVTDKSYVEEVKVTKLSQNVCE